MKLHKGHSYVYNGLDMNCAECSKMRAMTSSDTKEAVEKTTKIGRARIESVEYKNGTGYITFSYSPDLWCEAGANPRVEQIKKSQDYYQGPAFADEYEVEFVKKPRRIT